MSTTNFDNKTLRIIDHGEQEFADAMRFAFKFMDIKSIAGTRIAMRIEGIGDSTHYLQLTQYVDTNSKKATPLPFVMSTETAIAFAADWLKTAHYPRSPNHDGDSYPGFRISNQICYSESDIIDGIEIATAWCMYGK